MDPSVVDLLNAKAQEFNQSNFIPNDPISIPHRFSRKEDIEIAGFLTAIISWGRRDQILKNALKMMEQMDNAPFDFIMNFEDTDLTTEPSAIHRTFNSTDFHCFLKGLKNLYQNHNGLEGFFTQHQGKQDLLNTISLFKSAFFSIPHEKRSLKHISNPAKNSAAKRINMYLRWMIRKDNQGVDFGIWKNISPAKLSCPLDVHSGRVARDLGLLKRKQDDRKAVEELDAALRKLNPDDPVIYDFALFGLGVSGW